MRGPARQAITRSAWIEAIVLQGVTGRAGQAATRSAWIEAIVMRGVEAKRDGWIREVPGLKMSLSDGLRTGAALLLILCAIAIVMGLFAGCYLKLESEPAVTEPVVEQARVDYVIDGDTVTLEDGRKVRYLGIDTPEIGEYYYEEATQRNRELVEGKVVELRPGSRNIDDYGRYLRYIYVDGTFVCAELVAQGYAKAYRKGPEERYSQYLFQLEEEAKAGNKGLWAEP